MELEIELEIELEMEIEMEIKIEIEIEIEIEASPRNSLSPSAGERCRLALSKRKSRTGPVAGSPGPCCF